LGTLSKRKLKKELLLKANLWFQDASSYLGPVVNQLDPIVLQSN
jgi:hypothetical protein